MTLLLCVHVLFFDSFTQRIFFFFGVRWREGVYIHIYIQTIIHRLIQYDDDDDLII